MNTQQLITTLTIGLIHLSVAAAETSEENIFNALREAGAFVEFSPTSPSELPGTGEFKLSRLNCESRTHPHPTEFSCTFVDLHRPFEEVSFEGPGAQIVYESLVAEAVEERDAPFFRGAIKSVSAPELRCSKHGFTESRLSYACFLMKRLKVIKKPSVDGVS
ncbi:MAG: hypothetical protein ABIR96_12335 [Bdellovibrionota bacterium]